MTKKGTLYIIPTPLGEHISSFFFNRYYLDILQQTNIFIVEELRTTRRLLRKLIPNFPIDNCTFLIYNEHNLQSNLNNFIEPLLNGHNVALMSEAGCPAIADPGNAIILFAHKHEIKVVPLIGPSSIIMALMASGLPAQSFKFHGYLPAKTNELQKAIQKIEKQSKTENITQIFIETPYRNQSIFEKILNTCSSNTYLSVSINLTQPDELIVTKTIEQWRKNGIIIPKNPAIFIIYSGKL